MARKRLISPEFFTHAELHDAEAACGLPLRLAFAGLWTACDRRGLFRWRPRELKLAVLPYDDVDFAAVLNALHAAGFVRRYVIDGKEYGVIPSFEDWQTFHPHEKPSDCPEPSGEWIEPTIVRPEPANVRRNHSVTVTSTVASTDPIAGTITDPAIAGTAKPSTIRVKKPREPAPFMGRLNGTWKRHLGGDLPPGSATQLRPVVTDIGEEEADKRLDAYLDATDPEYVSVRSFVAKHGAYGPGKSGVDPVTGLPNILGMRALGGGR